VVVEALRRGLEHLDDRRELCGVDTVECNRLNEGEIG